MKAITLGFLAAIIAATSVMAGDETINKDYKQPTAALAPCFKDQEFQVDLFGSFMNMPFEDTHLYNGHFHSDTTARSGGGGGVGVNYFFMRYFGLGVDGDFDSNEGGIASYTGKIILRLPIEAGGVCIAPYVFGGGGGQSTLDDYNNGYYSGPRGFRRALIGNDTVGALMAGAGLEWRVIPRCGMFVEGRYTWTFDTARMGDNDRVRAGLRIAF